MELSHGQMQVGVTIQESSVVLHLSVHSGDAELRLDLMRLRFWAQIIKHVD